MNFIFVLYSVAEFAENISASINSILMLNGTNIKTWRENVEIVLGVTDLDLALRTTKPHTITDASTPDQKRGMER